MARPLPPTSWPDGARAAVSITFDVDAECGFLSEGDEYARRLTMLSEVRFGPVRGLPRILALLEELAVPATFYVPGDTAERHTAAVQTIVAAGHEIGHHGHLHLRSDRISADEQRAEIEQGFAALDRTLGVRPRGYRSASWEMTPETFAMLGEYGFAWDSSFMGDDRPYVEEHGGSSIVELPVHWSLDDWPWFFWWVEGGGRLARPEDVLGVWLAELDAALAEGRHVTFTMHPEIIGRAYRLPLLRGLLEAVREHSGLWVATHGEVADVVGAP